MRLAAHRYGKAQVRVLKVFRTREQHSIKEITVTAMLDGDFESSYTTADNSRVVPTDTIKNTINILAKDHLAEEIELFALALGQHFLREYKQVATARIDIDERDWQRLDIEQQPHPHTFVAGGDAKAFTHVVCARESNTIESGIRDLIILKSTGSGFENYPKDKFTTLPETADRVLATSLTGKWTFGKALSSYRDKNASILAAMLKIFANNYSPSAQTTLFQMGSAALEAVREISKIELALPNKHYLLVDPSRFGVENKNEVFTPTDEPHGQIEAIVTRDE